MAFCWSWLLFHLVAPRGAVGFWPVESNALPSKQDPTGLFPAKCNAGSWHSGICHLGGGGGTSYKARMTLQDFSLQSAMQVCGSFKSGLSVYLWATVASWLVCLTPERAVRVRALDGDIVLCSWARHLTLTVPISTQVYKWVLANCWGNLTKLRGSDLRCTSIPSRRIRNTSSHVMLQKLG